jgi:hypothetical protein
MPRRSAWIDLTKYRKWIPSGKAMGHQWDVSPRDSSRSVTGSTLPPSAETRVHVAAAF